MSNEEEKISKFKIKPQSPCKRFKGKKLGKENGNGKRNSPDGRNYVGEWKDDKEWNGNEYNKDGKIISKYVDGKEIKLYPP